ASLPPGGADQVAGLMPRERAGGSSLPRQRANCAGSAGGRLSSTADGAVGTLALEPEAASATGTDAPSANATATKASATDAPRIDDGRRIARLVNGRRSIGQF